MQIRILIFLSSLVAVAAGAAVSGDLSDWGKGPAQHLMSKLEIQRWKQIGDDADAKAFVDLFWARRDPTPATPANEFKAAFDERVTFADEHFARGRIRGSMSDRGKIIVLLGPPTNVVRSKAQPASITEESREDPRNDATAKELTETWIYAAERFPKLANGKELEIVFADARGNGDFRLGRNKINVSNVIEKTATAYVISPDLTEMPSYAAPAQRAAAVAPTAAARPAAMTELATTALREAYEQFKSATKSPYENVHVVYGEFVTPSGDHYVPIQIYLSSPNGIDLTKPVTLFGVIEDSTGKIVSVFEEPATLTSSKEDAFVDKTLALSPGTYRGIFGIAIEGKPLTIASSELAIKGLGRDDRGTSAVILSNNIFPLTEAQSPTDPFAFGGIKVVAKGDKSFNKSDELWYFVEIRNPGLGEDGKPKFQVKLDLEGMTDAKKKVKMGNAIGDADVSELKGVPGHFAVAASIPLAGLAPGDYTLKVKLVDTVSKQTYDLYDKFKITGE